MKYSLLLLGFIFITNISFAQWTKTAGPQETQANVIEAYNAKLFLGTQQAGLFKSLNGAASWSRVNSFPDSASLSGISNIIKYGDTIFVSTGNKIYKSDDSGANWQYAVNGIPDTMYGHNLYLAHSELFATALALDWNTNNMFTRLYRYIDATQTWSEINNIPALDPNITGLVALNDTFFLAVAGHGILKTHNYGSNWDSINANIGQINTNNVSLLASNGQAIFAIGTATNTELLSSPNGINWSSVPITALAFNTVTTMSVSHDTLILGSPGAVTVSYNGGTNWFLYSGPAYYNFYDIKFVGGTIYAADNTSGVQVSTNTTNWSLANTGIPYSSTFHLANPFNQLFAMNSYNTYHTVNAGNAWSLDTSLISNLHSLARMGNKLIGFSGADQQNLVSWTQGQTWRYDTGTGCSMVVDNTLVDNEHRKLYAISQNDVRRSDDYGASWTSLFYANASNTHDTVFTSMARVKGRIFVTTADTGLHLLYSDDSGSSWHLDTAISNATLVLSVDTILVVGTTTGIMRSINLGNTFTVATSSYQLNKTLVNGNIIFNYGAPAPNAVKYSPDYGTSWIDVSNTQVQQINSLAIDNTYLYAGTQSAGVWRRALTDIGVTYTADTTNNYTLGVENLGYNNSDGDKMSVFPNPYSTQTNIVINTLSDHFIDLKVYDAMGRCVKTLAQDKFAAGKHVFVLQGGMPAGIYFVVASMDGRTINGKIIKQ